MSKHNSEQPAKQSQASNFLNSGAVIVSWIAYLPMLLLIQDFGAKEAFYSYGRSGKSCTPEVGPLDFGLYSLGAALICAVISRPAMIRFVMISLFSFGSVFAIGVSFEWARNH